VCAELKERGLDDILIACMDGLKRLPEAIESGFPKVTIQWCRVHQIRNSIKDIPSTRTREFIKDLKTIYKATNEKIARRNLEVLEDKWGEKYPHAVASWVKNWEHISAYFQYPPTLRKLVYTTNAVEALHRRMRKVTKAKGVFPTSRSLSKMLYLAARDIEKKIVRVNGWKEIFSSLAVFFGDRFTSKVSA